MGVRVIGGGLSMCLMTASVAGVGSAVVFDVAPLSFDERCAAEALQGIVNRDRPVLFLGAMGDRWLKIYAERTGMTYERVDDLRELLTRFSRVAKGLIIYDETVDGARYVAITLAGLEDLVPVSSAMLEGTTPGFRARSSWPGIDFRHATDGQLAEWRRAAQPRITLVPNEGLEMTEGNPEPGKSWSFVSFGPLSIDLGRYPFLEADVDAGQGESAQWMIKLTWDRDGDGRVAGGRDDLPLSPGARTGVTRWNIAEMTGLSGHHTFTKIQLHVLGEGARILWHRIRFVSSQGDSPPPAPPAPLSIQGLPVVHDLRGRFANSLAAYEWALSNLMPRCNRRYAHSADGPCEGANALCGPMPGMDWVTMNRGFAFNLACSPERRPSYGGALVGGSPGQAAMYRRILAALGPLCQITGYGEPEDYWCKLISEHGHYSFHFGTNWSFHSRIPHNGRFRQKGRVTPETATVRDDMYYVCFMTSEGDTMKGPLPFFMGSWFDPARGTIPMNWGINPIMAKQFPAMLSYFYDSATENDCFFAGCSGAGYTYPDFMPNLEQFASFSGAMCRLADTSCIDMWHAGKRDVRKRYAQASGAMALTANGGSARMSMAAPGVIVVDHGLMYWQHAATGTTAYVQAFRNETRRRKAVDWLVGRIEDIAMRHTPPFVILVYADLHGYDRHVTVHREVAERLDPRRFRPARLDEALAAVTAWTRGRVLVGHDSINQQLAAAVLAGVPTTYRLSLTNGREEKMSTSVRLLGTPGLDTVEVVLPPNQTVKADLVIRRKTPGTDAPCGVRVGDNRYPLDITVVPYTGPAKRAESLGMWDAVDLRHAGGTPARLESALRGRAWASPEPGGKQSHIVFGPYAELPAGRCLVAFRMQLPAPVSGDGADTLATLDVNCGGYDGTGESLGVTRVRGADFAPPGHWRWFTTVVDWPGLPSRLETRVWWHGTARLLVDRVAIFRLQPD